MEIKGKVHCMFEQSGTFKNEFKKLGYEAFDYDIQNNFGETDYVIDLFNEIDNAYDNKPSIFDNITPDDLIVAFFPCIYFCGSSNPILFNGTGYHKPILETIPLIIERSINRERFYELLLKFIHVVYKLNLRMVFENPYDDSMCYLKNNFIAKPSVWDRNRMLRGDWFVKPTGYWFFNCEPTQGFSSQFDKDQKVIRQLPSGKAGLCSEERSMISPDYARNWICDFVLGKKQDIGQLQLF